MHSIQLAIEATWEKQEQIQTSAYSRNSNPLMMAAASALEAERIVVKINPALH